MQFVCGPRWTLVKDGPEMDTADNKSQRQRRRMNAPDGNGATAVAQAQNWPGLRVGHKVTSGKLIK